MTTYAIGIVINPKLKLPTIVTCEDDLEVDIWSLQGDNKRIGGGSYETTDPTYLRPAEVSNMPRVHTPDGVKPTGKGYGTTLYTGLCVGAHLQHEGILELDADQDGDGVSSEAESRSPSASRWWDRAVQLGLAFREEDERVQEDVQFDYDELTNCKDYDDRDVTVTYARGDVVEEFEYDIYPYDRAERGDLVLASFKIEIPRDPNRGGLRGWKKFLDETGDWEIEDVETDRILAANLRGISKDGLNFISALMVANGVSDQDIDTFRLRGELGIDPSVPIRQMRLPFTPNSKRSLEAINEQTQELRESMAWDALAALP